MAADLQWKVISVPGHELEARLQQLTDDNYEVFAVDRSGTRWTVVARTADARAKKGNSIGFRAPDK